MAVTKICTANCKIGGFRPFAVRKLNKPQNKTLPKAFWNRVGDYRTRWGFEPCILTREDGEAASDLVLHRRFDFLQEPTVQGRGDGHPAKHADLPGETLQVHSGVSSALAGRFFIIMIPCVFQHLRDYPAHDENWVLVRKMFQPKNGPTHQA